MIEGLQIYDCNYHGPWKPGTKVIENLTHFVELQLKKCGYVVVESVN